MENPDHFPSMDGNSAAQRSFDWKTATRGRKIGIKSDHENLLPTSSTDAANRPYHWSLFIMKTSKFAKSFSIVHSKEHKECPPSSSYALIRCNSCVHIGFLSFPSSNIQTPNKVSCNLDDCKYSFPWVCKNTTPCYATGNGFRIRRRSSLNADSIDFFLPKVLSAVHAKFENNLQKSSPFGRISVVWCRLIICS